MLGAFKLVGRLNLSIAGWMTISSLVAFVPLFVFSTAIVYQQLQERRAEAHEILARRATRTAQGVGRELQGVLYALQTMAQSGSAQRGDVPALYALTSRVAAADRRLYSLSLSELDGRQVFSTLRPLGTVLPETAGKDVQRSAIERRVPVVSPLVTGKLSGAPLVAILMPLQFGERSDYALRAALLPTFIQRALLEGDWPADWTAAVLDQNHVIVARSHDSERYVGQSAHASLIDGIDAGRTQFNAITKDLTPALVSVAPVPGTGWTVAVGRPLAQIDAQVYGSMAILFGAGFVCIVLGLGTSQYLARRLSREVEKLTPGAAMADAHGPVREVSLLSAALKESRWHARLAHDALHDARHDALTGLPARALFMEQAHELAADLAAADAGLALLFIDLDGFKRINDSHGHGEGDRLLQRVADVLRHSLRNGDVLGRLGGDEFIVCIRAPRAQVRDIGADAAQRILRGVRAVADGVSCSIGTAFAFAPEELVALIARADHAMLQAKRLGKDQVSTAA